MKKVKIFRALVILTLLFSVTGCCLLALLLGVAVWAFVQKYGQLIYFADFWMKTGSQDMANRIHKDIEKYKKDPGSLPPPDAQGVFTLTGTISYDDPIVQGQYAKYSSNSHPLRYVLQIKKEDSELSLKKMTINGTIAISDHALEESVVKRAESIIFKDTAISVEGAVVDGVVQVGDQALKLSEYSDLINDFLASQKNK